MRLKPLDENTGLLAEISRPIKIHNTFLDNPQILDVLIKFSVKIIRLVDVLIRFGVKIMMLVRYLRKSWVSGEGSAAAES
jgi:hypothetical protein